MDAATAFVMGAANGHKAEMVFDWHKAAELCRNAQSASAGLRGDWEWTGGEILRDGIPVSRDDSCAFLASTWAVPELMVDGELLPCFVMEDVTEWSSDTFWPDSALAILRGDA